MLLIPPGHEAEQFYCCDQRDRMHMIGVFGNASAAAEQQTRISTGSTQKNTKMILQLYSGAPVLTSAA